MATDSTKDDAFGTRKRDRIARAYAKHLVPSPPDLLVEALQDHFRSIDAREVFRVGMMIGYFDEG